MDVSLDNISEVGNTIPLHAFSSSLSSLTDSLEHEDLNGDVEEHKLEIKSSRLPVLTKTLRPIQNGDSRQQFGVNGKEKSDSSGDLRPGRKECYSVEPKGQRETITSRMRIKNSHSQHGNEADDDDYLTPTQRKSQTIRDLKKQVKDLVKMVEEKDLEIHSFKSSVGQETETILEIKNTEINNLNDTLETKETELEDLSASQEESTRYTKELEAEIHNLTAKMEEKEKHHGEMYLEMYEKGRRTAEFERKDELEMVAKTRHQRVTTKELVKKLTESQAELAKWQSLQRREMYTMNDKQETEAEATLKFLKDSFFHFLVSDRDADDHLRAMINIFKFSDVQKRKMAKALRERKKATGKS